MYKNLNEWLAYIEKLHPTEIELGLTRIAKVAKKLDLINFPATVITVGGTNGKGTTCAFLEEILIQAGYKVGVYSSPHIQRFTERLRINHQELPDQMHCDAFEKIETARENVSLSFFEYVTLSCLQLLKDQQCDFIILEVGLGGRLDATNIVQSDISVITTIAIDHVDWLGDNREVIKALENNQLATWPITKEAVEKYLPDHASAMDKGLMRRQQQGLRSTKT